MEEVFTNIQTTLNNDVDTFIKYINDNDYPMANAFYPTVESDLIKLAEIHNDIVGCIKRYDVLNKRITFIDPDITDAYYIPFMRRFVSGISDYSDSGILGSIAYQWNDKHKLIKDALAKHTEKLVNNYLKAFGNFSPHYSVPKNRNKLAGLGFVDSPGPAKYYDSININPRGKYSLSKFVNTPKTPWSQARSQRFAYFSKIIY